MNHNRETAASFVAGGTVLWASLAEFALGRMVATYARGVAGFILLLGEIHAGALAGFGTFLRLVVEQGVGNIPAIIARSWQGTGAEWLGPLAPVLLTAELVAVSAVFVWGVRRL